jgi:hypothetical protein
MVQDYSGIAKAGEIQGKMYAQMGKDVGGMIDKGVDTYKQVKQFKGQQEAFGKSMDYMAKAFPDRAEMFNNAKSAAFDPNANLIQQAAAIDSYGSNIDMIAKMEAQQQALEAQRQQMQISQKRFGLEQAAAGGGSGGSSPPAGGAPQGFDYNQ